MEKVVRKYYYQIDLEGEKVLKVYGSYTDLKNALGEVNASNIAKIANDKAQFLYSLLDCLWTTIPANVAEAMTYEKACERAINKVQADCVRVMFIKLNKLMKHLYIESEARLVKDQLMIFLKNTKLSV